MIQVNSRKCISANKYLLIYIDSSFIPQMLILANLFWNLKKIVKFRNRQRKLVYSVYINHSENRMHHYNIRCVCVWVLVDIWDRVNILHLVNVFFYVCLKLMLQVYCTSFPTRVIIEWIGNIGHFQCLFHIL